MGTNGATYTAVSAIQKWMVNHQKIIPMGQLQGITVDTQGANALA